MTDIDFEELDRAVNSIIGGKPQATVVQSGGSPAQPSPSADSGQSVAVSVNSRPAPVVAERSVPAEPAPRPVGPIGRFMDVMHPSADMRSAQTPAAPKSDPEPAEPEITPESDTTTEPVEDKSPESPFLPDAKVDKRPLGGAPAPVPDSPLPEELQNNLLSIEAGSNTGETTETVPTADSSKLTDSHKPDQQPAGVDSSMFGKSTYHQPLAHPAKIKSGWTWVIWTLVLIALGVGAGALMYFVILPNL